MDTDTDQQLDQPDELELELEELIADLPTLAEDEEPAPYFDLITGQDDLTELGAAGDAPRSPREAVQLGREWVLEAVFLGVGYCLRAIRSLFGVEALWPDASTAWEEAEHKHRTDDPEAIPFGRPVFWTNAGHGHIAISLGNGWCLTTDYVTAGRLGRARIADLGPWCGGRLVGYTDDLNGVEVWRKREPRPWTLEDRLALVRAALERARRNDAPERRIAGLRTWRNQLREQISNRNHRQDNAR